MYESHVTQENEGPVRGVHFHPNLPLFVSGADSGHVRVWNYKQKRCTFVLKGHVDYVRTTYFHHERPWILSASDDQTMRIWNYQNRKCINLITGHMHYVMCAQFHPEKDLIVSASLDSTVRVWDFSNLRKRLTETKSTTDIIIEIDCIKILEGHERGCNWVTFHHLTNLIASGSDDHKIKLWKYSDEDVWEYSTLFGHQGNVSCLAFNTKTNQLVSNSEDRTLKIWDI
jgi:coatomer protein complex subunit alpha (xenin)